MPKRTKKENAVMRSVLGDTGGEDYRDIPMGPAYQSVTGRRTMPRVRKGDAPRAIRPRPGLKDYAQSTLGVLKGLDYNAATRTGAEALNAIGRYANETTPGDAASTAGEIAKALPGALYETITTDPASLLPMVSTVREGAQMRAEGRDAEAADFERQQALVEAANFIPLGFLGKGAKVAARGARNTLGRLVPRTAAPLRDVAFATSERVPYINAGHLPGLFDDEAARVAYSSDPRASWTDPAGQDILYKALGVSQEATRPATGFYRPPGRPGVVETNPATVGLPHITRSGGEVSEADRRALDAAEAVRAYFDAQGAGAWHSVDPTTAGGSMFIPQEATVDAEKLADLARIMKPVGLGDIVDTGKGVTLSNFYPGPPTSDVTAGMLRSGRAENLADLMGAYPQPVSVDSGYRSMFERIDPHKDRPDYVPGSGRITEQLEKLLSEYPEAVSMLDASPEVRSRIASGADLDEVTGRLMGGADPYVQTARDIAAQYGLRDLFSARRHGVPLPALAAPLLGYGLYQGDDGSGY